MKSYIIIYFLLFSIILNAQCIDQVNFNYWTMEGNPNSTWIVLNDSTVLENGDAQPPTFFVGNEEFLNVKIRGKMKVIDCYDDDFLGFVFGYKSPSSNTSDTDCSVIPTNIISWNWDFGDGTTSNDINTEHAYEASGSYPVQLMVIDNNDCRDSVLRIITVKPPPDVNLGPDTLISYKGSITLNAGFLGAYYYWSTGEDTRTITLNNLRKDTLVGVEVNYEGCNGYDEILISVADPPPTSLYMPNAFSPNGDSKNDIFKPVSKNVDKFKMYIYNRWGALIYETNDPSNGWDGKFNGSECSLGVYIWKIVYDNMGIEEDVTNKTLLGHVILVR